MDQLAEQHKECLRELLKLVREKTIPEEFCFFYINNAPTIDAKCGLVHVEGVSRLGLEALTREGYLFSMPGYDRRSSKTSTMTTIESEHEISRECYITPKGMRAVDNNFAPSEEIIMRRPPVEITSSLYAFKNDYPDPTRLAFVMMQFGESKDHREAFEAIRKTLEPHQIFALRADEKEYHNDLFYNVLTYIYGCRFGIAVFERIESDSFNPNVSLEIGYMQGLEKQVCFLKERTLKTLPSDLTGKLYREFDLQSCYSTIQPKLLKWMADKGMLSTIVVDEDRKSNQ